MAKLSPKRGPITPTPPRVCAECGARTLGHTEFDWHVVGCPSAKQFDRFIPGLPKQDLDAHRLKLALDLAKMHALAADEARLLARFWQTVAEQAGANLGLCVRVADQMGYDLHMGVVPKQEPK